MTHIPNQPNQPKQPTNHPTNQWAGTNPTQPNPNPPQKKQKKATWKRSQAQFSQGSGLGVLGNTKTSLGGSKRRTMAVELGPTGGTSGGHFLERQKHIYIYISIVERLSFEGGTEIGNYLMAL